MPQDGLRQYLHEGGIVAGELPACSAGRTAWVGIYPLDVSDPGARSLLEREGLVVFPGADVRAYRVRTFEIADALRDTYFGEGDLENVWSRVVIGDDALFELLESRGIPIACLDSARVVDYPL